MSDVERLYALLPAVHRLRDAEGGQPLRALLGVLQAELDRVEANVADLADSWFIETCPEWLVPYIGDLVGNRPLIEVAHGRRADVAKTLYYRRRKGTVAILEELARNVTGWGAHVVEMMETLAWTQHVNHVRRELVLDPERRQPRAVERVGSALARATDALDLLDGPFDRTAHTVDVRRAPEGRHGVRTIAFFLWRLRHYPLDDAPARRADAPAMHGWHFSALGARLPLFTRPLPERDAAFQATELHVPGPIRPLAFRQDIMAFRRRWLPEAPADRPLHSDAWYGTDRSFHIVADGVAVRPEALLCKDLGAWASPPAGRVAVDVRRGRIAFAPGEEPTEVRVSYAWGFSADLGGGPYDRRASLADGTAVPFHAVVAKGGEHETLQQALAAWANAGHPDGVIDIADSDVYGGALTVSLPARTTLVIQAVQGSFPSVRTVGNLVVEAPDEDARLVLNGLLLEGAMELSGRPTLELHHCTVVPGRMLDEEGEPWFGDRDAITVAAGEDAAVVIDHSIVGAIRLPETARTLVVRDAILHGLSVGGTPRPAIAADDAAAQPGPLTRLERVTVFGAVHVREMHASDVLFTGTVRTQRTQGGCVRFCHVPAGSATPRRFRCQPDLALEGVSGVAERDRIRARMEPRFNALRYGDPAYAQLHRSCAAELRTGASNGAEMGAFNRLLQPQREANLRTRLDEYMPFGLAAALIHVT